MSALVEGVGGKSPPGCVKSGITIGICRVRCLRGFGRGGASSFSRSNVSTGLCGEVGEGCVSFRTDSMTFCVIIIGTCLGLRLLMRASCGTIYGCSEPNDARYCCASEGVSSCVGGVSRLFKKRSCRGEGVGILD